MFLWTNDGEWTSCRYLQRMLILASEEICVWKTGNEQIWKLHKLEICHTLCIILYGGFPFKPFQEDWRLPIFGNNFNFKFSLLALMTCFYSHTNDMARLRPQVPEVFLSFWTLSPLIHHHIKWKDGRIEVLISFILARPAYLGY